MARCDQCPAAAGLACRGDVDPRYGFFCRQAAAGASRSQLAAIRALAGEPRPTAPAPAAAPARVPLAVSLATLRAVRACPDAGPPRCSCRGLRGCRRLGRDVSHPECFACVSDADSVDVIGPLRA